MSRFFLFFENRNKKFYFLLYFILPCSFNLVTLAMINTNKFQSFIKVSVAFAFTYWKIINRNYSPLAQSGWWTKSVLSIIKPTKSLYETSWKLSPKGNNKANYSPCFNFSILVWSILGGFKGISFFCILNCYP